MGENGAPRRGGIPALAMAAGMALAGCAAAPPEAARAPAAAPAESQVHPGSAILARARTGGMAAQYSSPRPGRVAATGASAWVPSAPPPAFVAAAPAPAASAPPPAAVAGRQPAAPADVDASQIVRPEAAGADAAAPAAPISDATREEGRRMFADYSCNVCHALADAGATGAIGPSLDNPALTRDFVIDVVNFGRGAMPSFAGQMSEAEIATLATYIVESARR